MRFEINYGEKNISNREKVRRCLEDSTSLVPESPLANLPESSRKGLDASRIYSLQRTNGFNFSVKDKAIVRNMVELGNIEVVKDGSR